MKHVALLSLPGQEPEGWNPGVQSLLEYILSQESVITSGAALTRAGLDALAPMSVTGLLADDLAAGIHVLDLLHRLLDKTSGDEDLGDDAFALSGRWSRQARRFLGWEDRQNVLLADFPGHAAFIPLFRRVGLGVTMLPDVPAGVEIRELAHVTEAIPVRDAVTAKMVLS